MPVRPMAAFACGRKRGRTKPCRIQVKQGSWDEHVTWQTLCALRSSPLELAFAQYGQVDFDSTWTDEEMREKDG